jgi:hypothetical protein
MVKSIATEGIWMDIHLHAHVATLRDMLNKRNLVGILKHIMMVITVVL